MSLSKEEKKEIIIKESHFNKNNVLIQEQINFLSCEIEKLNKHLKEHPSDYHSKRGLLIKNRKLSCRIKELKQYLKEKKS
ncbi:MAG: 30S ribosomal protein S15 [Candidatus Phytoplasma stylosanthis]|uniref:30S ribosomal protein S15 n=1 Tax=Candidatus Phytoplasma stylosanthis TaxID=2798314 RepID=UPI00293A7FEB|nr:30S ribosomal protein S15 [Candidatus Phytoplasma stylosanthis]MDV3167976.1 30S ribosomal protein S15 [Candidatus Phytoplasma stylosanthis]MDV3170777.1 30S ribosomal protein S15 [Candidatus Phytoplasma stylosanthis]MDV3173549.1 30S ribosomal protein S15 [Candidatus Phytoplasma stylosanthis]MDV3174289.1 30S ribosomal protein S15 [Candidatus Phytoplasma stylosanthis]MDV3202734.1 30S ribosomal protein S15 [Candidatus Phytoplasma stylosanthis]